NDPEHPEQETEQSLVSNAAENLYWWQEAVQALGVALIRDQNNQFAPSDADLVNYPNLMALRDSLLVVDTRAQRLTALLTWCQNNNLVARYTAAYGQPPAPGAGAASASGAAAEPQGPAQSVTVTRFRPRSLRTDSNVTTGISQADIDQLLAANMVNMPAAWQDALNTMAVRTTEGIVTQNAEGAWSISDTALPAVQTAFSHIRTIASAQTRTNYLRHAGMVPNPERLGDPAEIALAASANNTYWWGEALQASRSASQFLFNFNFPGLQLERGAIDPAEPESTYWRLPDAAVASQTLLTGLVQANTAAERLTLIATQQRAIRSDAGRLLNAHVANQRARISTALGQNAVTDAQQAAQSIPTYALEALICFRNVGWTGQDLTVDGQPIGPNARTSSHEPGSLLRRFLSD
ncbi:MAG: hypothetical protein ACRC9T_01525, partial [Vibrionaceae bacterium]